MARKKISYSDHALLRLDDPKNLMVITGLITLDAPLDIVRLKAVLEKSLLRFRRFRQRLAQPRLPFERPCWEDDPNFDLDSHLVQVELPFPADKKSLQDLISSLMSIGLDSSRPLWEFYLVENYGKGSAIIARLHHSLGDGIALMQVLFSLTDFDADSSLSGRSKDFAQDPVQSSSRPIKTNRSAVLNSYSWSTKDLWEEAKLTIFHPSHARFRARQIIDLSKTAGRLVFRWPDPPTIFKGSLGIEKRAAWSEPIDLNDVKDIGKEYYCTVNDVLLAAMAGALGKYIDSRGGAAEDLAFRSLIPVNLRPNELDEELGNRFGLVFLSLPIGIDDPIERLRVVKHDMEELISSSEPIATFGIINLLGALPSRIEETAVYLADTKATTVMTNIPGSQTQLSMAGAPMNTVIAWVPQYGRIGLGVSLISYNGKVWLGIASDKSLVPDPEAIIAYFIAEFNEMRAQAQKTKLNRQNSLKPLFNALDGAIKILDELLASTSKD